MKKAGRRRLVRAIELLMNNVKHPIRRSLSAFQIVKKNDFGFIKV
jgi:hypothetical protein